MSESARPSSSAWSSPEDSSGRKGRMASCCTRSPLTSCGSGGRSGPRTIRRRRRCRCSAARCMGLLRTCPDVQFDQTHQAERRRKPDANGATQLDRRRSGSLRPARRRARSPRRCRPPPPRTPARAPTGRARSAGWTRRSLLPRGLGTGTRRMRAPAAWRRRPLPPRAFHVPAGNRLRQPGRRRSSAHRPDPAGPGTRHRIPSTLTGCCAGAASAMWSAAADRRTG